MSSNLITHYFSELSPQQAQQFLQLQEIYTFWNVQINVISRKDMDNFYTHHVLHSLAIAKYKDLNQYQKVIDIGTGGGFPAIPLAILFPDTQFIAVDSIGKKIKVVNEVAQTLGLENVVGIQKRIEELKEPSRLYVTRAVARSQKLWNWIRPRLKVTKHDLKACGILALKGGDLEEELMELHVPFIERKLHKWFDEEFFETKSLIHIYPTS